MGEDGAGWRQVIWGLIGSGKKNIQGTIAIVNELGPFTISNKFCAVIFPPVNFIAGCKLSFQFGVQVIRVRVGIRCGTFLAIRSNKWGPQIEAPSTPATS